MGYFIQPELALPRPTQRLRPLAPVDNFGEMAKNEVPQFFTVESGYRFYSPELGRWLSRDPIEEVGGLNLYAFVSNNPVDLLDMLGLSDYPGGHHFVVRQIWKSWARRTVGGLFITPFRLPPPDLHGTRPGAEDHALQGLIIKHGGACQHGRAVIQ
jgi:RHS repeat-associated protein